MLYSIKYKSGGVPSKFRSRMNGDFANRDAAVLMSEYNLLKRGGSFPSGGFGIITPVVGVGGGGGVGGAGGGGTASGIGGGAVFGADGVSENEMTIRSELLTPALGLTTSTGCFGCSGTATNASTPQ